MLLGSIVPRSIRQSRWTRRIAGVGLAWLALELALALGAAFWLFG
ncbi:hypothetical protein A6F68_02312 [Tsuneonella dongtanensis]|uniref:Uncharacterized protein n=1 Tax=Tsuneonella dongtanensis TaxID=692370 RepID=A0A1B2AF78_9SPHN|nr:hypothetical protein [Tsuneonella dongtanensis]ANY20812.1 hypothetical protein A6F68_02312 [Tsuneonella dongtanensis]